jgi:flagellin-like protein
MNTKGVSAVIATILMLLITIALAGTAYLYITGIFTAKTGVVLSIDGTQSICTVSAINVVVKNDGTSVATLTGMTVSKPDSTALTCATGSTLTGTANAGGSTTLTCNRPTGTTAGLYALVVSAASTSASGSLYCGAAS